MSLDIKKFTRKPFTVEAVRVTEENFNKVAEWCESPHIHHGAHPTKSFFKVEVKNPINDKQTQAYFGDWVLKTTNGYKVYTDYAFHHNFEPSGEFVIGGLRVVVDEGVPEDEIHIRNDETGETTRVTDVSTKPGPKNVFDDGDDIQAMVDRVVAPLENPNR